MRERGKNGQTEVNKQKEKEWEKITAENEAEYRVEA